MEQIENYDYEPISNDSMNAKLSYWFKFYMYMKKVGEFHELKISIIKVSWLKSIVNMKIYKSQNFM